MKILVTGGAGFIGSHLVDRLILEGHKVVIVDRKTKKERRFDNKKAKYFTLEIGDETLSEVFIKGKFDAVCHLAAQISVVESVKDPVFDAQTNIVDAIFLLEEAKKNNVKKFVFISSGGAIYGERLDLPTSEIMDATPISPYGIAKQSFENYLFGAKDLQGSILRFANIYGPRQMPDGEAGVISIFLDKIFNNQTATIFGDGSATRDYVFVEDAVDGIYRALMSDFHGTANIGTGQETSVLELWNALKNVHDGDVLVEHKESRPGEISRSSLSARHAKDVLGWEPKVKIEDGLLKTYKWFKENK